MIRFRSLQNRIIIFFLMSFCFPFFLHAYDFRDLRLALEHDLEQGGTNPSGIRVAIVYNIPEHERIKEMVNLVKLKRDLSFEMLNGFQVTDPIVVQDIQDRNNLDPSSIKSDPDVMRQFFERAENTHLLLAEVRSQGSDLIVSLDLLDRERRTLSFTQKTVSPEDEQREPTASREISPTTSSPSSSPSSSSSSGSMFSFLDDLNITSEEFNPNHNDGWLYFTPTAYLNPRNNFIDLAAWPKKLEDTDIRMEYFRYGKRFGPAQFGWQSYGDAELGHHSSYISARYQTLDQSALNIPANVTLGFRYRVYWNEKNTEFINEDKEIEEQNQARNASTLFATISTQLPQFRFLGNFYLDNQSYSLGGKFLITSNIKVMGELVRYYYEGALLNSDGFVAIQAYSDIGSSVSLGYKNSSERTIVNFQFDY